MVDLNSKTFTDCVEVANFLASEGVILKETDCAKLLNPRIQNVACSPRGYSLSRSIRESFDGLGRKVYFVAVALHRNGALAGADYIQLVRSETEGLDPEPVCLAPASILKGQSAIKKSGTAISTSGRRNGHLESQRAFNDYYELHAFCAENGINVAAKSLVILLDPTLGEEAVQAESSVHGYDVARRTCSCHGNAGLVHSVALSFHRSGNNNGVHYLQLYRNSEGEVTVSQLLD